MAGDGLPVGAGFAVGVTGPGDAAIWRGEGFAGAGAGRAAGAGSGPDADGLAGAAVAVPGAGTGGALGGAFTDGVARAGDAAGPAANAARTSAEPAIRRVSLKGARTHGMRFGLTALATSPMANACRTMTAAPRRTDRASDETPLFEDIPVHGDVEQRV